MVSRNMIELYFTISIIGLCKGLPNKDHTTCVKERFIGPDHRAVTLFRLRVRRLG
jgi:hypothetical protein